MKNLLTILLLIVSTFVFAQNENSIDSKIEKVTVFFQGAQITRTAKLSIPVGKSILKFNGLSPFIDKKSVKIKGDGSFILLSVNTDANFLEQTNDTDSTAVILEQISTLKENHDFLNTQTQIINDKLSFLSENRKVLSNDRALAPTEFQKYNEYYGKQISDLRISILQNKKDIFKNQKDIDKLTKQYNTILKNKDLPSTDIKIIVSSKIPSTGTVELTYFVKNAGWFPGYNIRVDDIEHPVQLSYKANLFQNTGVDWDNVLLTFSNASPTTSGTLPNLNPYLLGYNNYQKQPTNYFNPNPNSIKGTVRDDVGLPLIGASILIKGSSIGTVTDIDGKFEIPYPGGQVTLKTSYTGYNTTEIVIAEGQHRSQIDIVLTEGVMLLEQVVVVGHSSTRNRKRAKKEKKRIVQSIPISVKKHETSFELSIDIPYNIKSDGKISTIQIKQFELPTSYVFKAVPKLYEKAFLIANITDWQQFNLLDGEANLYYENTFVGKTLINVSKANDTLELSLGEDKNITIKRVEDKKYSKKQFLGKYKYQTKVWKNIIRNNKSYSINILVYDQIPISQNKDFKVDVLELSGGILNNKTGKVTWEIDVAPNLETTKKIGYKIKYPKQGDFNIE